MTKLILPAPAKLNLFLHILGQRQDGYHQLQTVFQLLDYGDTLEFFMREDGEVHLECATLEIAPKDNLVYRAAQALKASCGTPLGADIVLNKRLPAGGGIGGGSSDAATTLLGLNHLWQTGVGLSDLADLGRGLGADVPVFVFGKSAWAEGIGDLLTPLDLPQKWYVILAPNCHVSTAVIFSHQGLTRNSSPIKVRAFLEEGGRNDCQPLVAKLYPQVKDAVDWLGQFGPAQLTGTGACVFAPFDDEPTANAVLAQRPSGLSGFVARGVNTSPLHQRLLDCVVSGV